MLRQYVIVPKKPKQSKGKMSSQVAHATFMALEKQRAEVEKELTPDKKGLCCGASDRDNIEEWKKTGMCVIVLECKDSAQLMGISKYLDQWGIINHIYIDEGLTEVAMGTPTALAIEVLDEDKAWMFQKLELFK